MDATLASASSHLFSLLPQRKPPRHVLFPSTPPRFRVSNSTDKTRNLRAAVNSTAKTVMLTAAAAFLVGKFNHAPARSQPPATVSDRKDVPDETAADPSSLVSSFLESSPEGLDALKATLDQKLESGDDDSALKIATALVRSQPEVADWKLLRARLLSEMSRVEEARRAFEEILEANPLWYPALMENALLMIRCGEGAAVIPRLEDALRAAEAENRADEGRDVRFIMAQMEFLQKNVEGALRRYGDLAREDPKDFRPHFCKGTIYGLMDMNAEAAAEFAKFRVLAPAEFEVEGFLRSPMSKMKMFETKISSENRD